MEMVESAQPVDDDQEIKKQKASASSSAEAHKRVTMLEAPGTAREPKTPKAAQHPLQILRSHNDGPVGYGAIRFPAMRRQPARWVRVRTSSPKSDADTIVRWARKSPIWPLPCPKLKVCGFCALPGC
jgi:hypothetical protein